jgi:hypothetical protein
VGLEVGPSAESIDEALQRPLRKCSMILISTSIGVQGVPFVFDNKYASGATCRNFVKTLEKYGKKANLI